MLEKNCVRCHGVTKASGQLDVREFRILTTPGKKRTYVVPKDLKKSYLWQRIDNGDMPQDAEMTEADRAIVRQWIETAAPAFVSVAVNRVFVSTAEMLSAIRDHLRDADDDDKPYLRFFTMTHLHNNPNITTEQLGRHRAALVKALNSLHWKKPIVIPRVIDKNGTVFAIDLRDLDWDKKDKEHSIAGRSSWGSIPTAWATRTMKRWRRSKRISMTRGARRWSIFGAIGSWPRRPAHPFTRPCYGCRKWSANWR